MFQVHLLLFIGPLDRPVTTIIFFSLKASALSLRLAASFYDYRTDSPALALIGVHIAGKEFVGPNACCSKASPFGIDGPGATLMCHPRGDLRFASRWVGRSDRTRSGC
jgi:hypothetical protein